MTFDHTRLDYLRAQMKDRLSPHRFAHTCGVEETAAQMAEIYCPEKTDLLRAAALLHDMTKEYTREQTDAVIAREGIALREDERESGQILHAITAPPEILRCYPEFAHSEVLSAVRWHTTARAGMTLAESILYLADVIEPGREYPALRALRERFFGALPEKMGYLERMLHLQSVLLDSLVRTRDWLRAKGDEVCAETLEAIEDLKTMR